MMQNGDGSRVCLSLFFMLWQQQLLTLNLSPDKFPEGTFWPLLVQQNKSDRGDTWHVNPCGDIVLLLVFVHRVERHYILACVNVYCVNIVRCDICVAAWHCECFYGSLCMHAPLLARSHNCHWETLPQNLVLPLSVWLSVFTTAKGLSLSPRQTPVIINSWWQVRAGGQLFLFIDIKILIW